MTAYRDETETLRARVAQLEDQLAKAEAENASLRGLGQGESTAARLFGGPLVLEEELSVEGTLTQENEERLVEILRLRFGELGRVTHGKTGGLTWRTRAATNRSGAERRIEVTVHHRDGRTHVRMVERLSQIAGGLFGGVVGGFGGGVGIGLTVPLCITAGMAWLIPIAVPAMVLGTWLVVRAAFARISQQKARQLRATRDAIAELLASQTGPRARVSEALSGDEAGATDDASAGEDEEEASNRERSRARQAR